MSVRQSAGQVAIRFFLLSAALLTLAGILATGLAAVLPSPPAGSEPLFPPAFAISTGCLLAGSWFLSRAADFVRRERQTEFRRALRIAVGFGAGFVAVQSYALSVFFRQQAPVQAATGATSFIAVAVALHGLHFLIAWLFVIYVALQAHLDRYDHEYHPGVIFCAWFWHALGIVWLAVLCVMAIANQGLIDDGITVDRELSKIHSALPGSLAVSHSRADKLP